jgi:hypothetical protein
LWRVIMTANRSQVAEHPRLTNVECQADSTADNV